jgi:pimeloyl-ACP methyl ester carboxylesterase
MINMQSINPGGEKMKLGNMTVSIQRACLCLMIAAVLFTGYGCGFSKLKKDMSFIQGNLCFIKGDVEPHTYVIKPVMVVLWKEADPKRTVLRYWLMQGRGGFKFMVNAPGEYRMMAFEDENRDMEPEAVEPFGLYPEHGSLNVTPGQTVIDAEIVIGRTAREGMPAITVRTIGMDFPGSYPGLKVSLDEVTTLDDPRFSQENADMGQWEPSRFVRDVGGGVFFLEPYDPGRMPVLFIHGANGSPGDWRYIIEHIDRKRIQPWMAYYASGMPLDTASEMYYRALTELQLKYGFKRIGIVAHSMGGLLSKGIINELINRRSPVDLPSYVTISTPWGGHEAAEMGTKDAPAVVPSWWDVIPGSPYIEKLWKTSLPEDTRYYLLFSFLGKESLMISRNNDGVVAIDSELDLTAQKAASGIRGFNEDHNSILKSKEVVEYLDTALK